MASLIVFTIYIYWLNSFPEPHHYFCLLLVGEGEIEGKWPDHLLGLSESSLWHETSVIVAYMD
jgi:hypothetical protein